MVREHADYKQRRSSSCLRDAANGQLRSVRIRPGDLFDSLAHFVHDMQDYSLMHLHPT
jgi:hypothetical protein